MSRGRKECIGKTGYQRHAPHGSRAPVYKETKNFGKKASTVLLKGTTKLPVLGEKYVRSAPCVLVAHMLVA